MHRRHQLHQRIDVRLVVKLLEEFLALRLALLVHVLHVTPLEEAGVAEHYVAEVDGLASREDPSAKARLHELRQVAGVVDVRVGEDHVVDGLRIDRQVAVLLERLLAMPLVESAVKQDALSARLDEVHGSGRRSGSAKKRDLHGRLLSCL